MEKPNDAILQLIRDLEDIKNTCIKYAPTADKKDDYLFLNGFFKDGVSLEKLKVLSTTEFERVLNIIGVPDEVKEHIVNHISYFRSTKLGDDEKLNQYYKMIVEGITNYMDYYINISQTENDIMNQKIEKCNNYIQIFTNKEFNILNVEEFAEFLSQNGFYKGDRLLVFDYIVKTYSNGKAYYKDTVYLLEKIKGIYFNKKNSNYKMIVEDIREFYNSSRANRMKKYPVTDKARYFNVSEETIENILNTMFADSYMNRYIKVSKDYSDLKEAREFVEKVNRKLDYMYYTRIILDENKLADKISQEDSEKFYGMPVDDIKIIEGVDFVVASSLKTSLLVKKIDKVYNRLLELKEKNEEFFKLEEEIKDLIEQYNNRNEDSLKIA